MNWDEETALLRAEQESGRWDDFTQDPDMADLLERLEAGAYDDVLYPDEAVEADPLTAEELAAVEAAYDRSAP